jgi:purine-binding chemotaxis protein CheW
MARQLITRNIKAKEVMEGRDDNLDRYLSLVLGAETYGLSILKMKEINEYSELTPIPTMPDFIRGALNLRGQAVPVIDLAARLNKGEVEINHRTCIVIVELTFAGQPGMDVGLMVDGVSKVVHIRPEEINPAPTFGGNIQADFIQGMGKMDDRFLILLDIDAVLSLDDIGLLGQMNETPLTAEEGERA